MLKVGSGLKNSTDVKYEFWGDTIALKTRDNATAREAGNAVDEFVFLLVAIFPGQRFDFGSGLSCALLSRSNVSRQPRVPKLQFIVVVKPLTVRINTVDG